MYEMKGVRLRDIRSPVLLRQVALLCGYQCAFPGCDQALLIDKAIFIGEAAAILALTAHGPRHPEPGDRVALETPDNYLLLCPNHHRLVDHHPLKYSAEWLRDARARHIEKVRRVLGGQRTVEVKLPEQVEISLREAASIWRSSKANASEEFWQQLFQRCPVIIALLFPHSMFQLGSKCYVGGKSMGNANGNLVDFVYANKLTNNVELIEIKSPASRLLGKKYRGNAYAISEELTGSIAQLLNYKDTLSKEYYSLRAKESGTPFTTFSPGCVVIAGSIESEMDCDTKLKSFELFRAELSNVTLVTYDELFHKVQSVLDMVQ